MPPETLVSRHALLPVFALAGLLTLLPFAGAEAAACPSWTDVAGDASAGVPGTEDDNLDLLDAKVLVTANDVSVVLKVAGLADTPTGYGDEFALEATVDGNDLLFYVDRDPAFGETAAVYNLSTDASGDATATYDVAADTVTIKATTAAIDEALGSEAKGKAATSLRAYTSLQAAAVPIPEYDDAAPATGTTFTFGTACTASGGPAPTPTGSAPPAPSPSPTTGPGGLPAGYPQAGCDTFTDATGDGTPDAPIANGGVPVHELDNDPDLDVTGLVLGSTPAELVAFLRVDDLADLPATGNGHQFDVTFTHNGKAINLYTQQFDDVVAAQREVIDASMLLVANPPTGGKVGTTYNAGLEVTAEFDTANDVVVLRLTRESLDAVAGAAAPDGTTLTPISGASRMVTPTGGYTTADTVQAADAAARVFTMGESPCFAPPPAVLTNVGATTVQYGDAAKVAIRLTSAAGAPLRNEVVLLSLGGTKRLVKTAPDGVARTSLTTGATAGSHSLVASFEGDDAAGPATLTVPFKVVVEKTRVAFSVSRSGTKRTVTAKLLDDDGHPVAGQVLTLYVNGRKVASPRTPSSGAVTVSAVAGQTVKAVYAGLSGRYAPVTAQVRV